MGSNVNIEFVDTQRNGVYHMTMDPHEKDALLNTPDAFDASRFAGYDAINLPPGAYEQQFERLRGFALEFLRQSPPPKQ